MLSLSTSFVGKVHMNNISKRGNYQDSEELNVEEELQKQSYQFIEQQHSYCGNQLQMHAFIVIQPSVYLLATVETSRNQCVIQLVRDLPLHINNFNHNPYSSCKSSQTASQNKQRQQELQNTERLVRVNEAHIPVHILAELRIPHTIQLIEHHEGKIITVSFAICESSFFNIDDTQLPFNEREQKTHTEFHLEESHYNSVNSNNNNNNNDNSSRNNIGKSLHVLLFIGTSNGTMLVCNAIRGTILVIAKFSQKRNELISNSNINNLKDEISEGKYVTTNSNINNNDYDDVNNNNNSKNTLYESAKHSYPHVFEEQSHSEHYHNKYLKYRQTQEVEEELSQKQQEQEQEQQQQKELTESNVAIVKFAMIYDEKYNINKITKLNSECEKQYTNSKIATNWTNITSRRVSCVCVTHTNGKVITLDRKVLDAFATVITRREDGRRPYFFLETPVEHLGENCSFVAVGPAATILSLIDCEHTLMPIKKYSSVELQSCHNISAKNAYKYQQENLSKLKNIEVVSTRRRCSNKLPARVILNAIAFPLLLHREINFALETGLQQSIALLVCGRVPAFALYTLSQLSQNDRKDNEQLTTASSTQQAVHAVKSVMTNFAKSIWRNATGRPEVQERKTKNKSNASVKIHHNNNRNQSSDNDFVYMEQQEEGEKEKEHLSESGITIASKEYVNDNRYVPENHLERERVEERKIKNEESWQRGNAVPRSTLTSKMFVRVVENREEAENAFLQADITFSKIELDPRKQYAALYAEGQGRIYLVDSHTALVHRILKGCRAASFQWCEAKLHSTSTNSDTLLLVYLP